jgi:hypothetical protein
MFTSGFNADSPWVLGVGTSDVDLLVWDTSESRQLVEHFSKRLSKK